MFQSIATSMFYRCKTLCSEEQDRKANIDEAIDNLPKNGYQRRMVRHQLRRVFHPEPRITKEWIGTTVLPYKEGTSESIRRIHNQVNIRVAFQKGKTLRSHLVRLKDKLPQDRTTDCVYKIKCIDCSGVYIGQTAWELHVRLKEHQRKLKKTPRNEQEYQALVRESAIACHSLDTGHKVDLDNVEIIRRGIKFAPQRLITEALEITRAQNSLNKVEGVELSKVWLAVLSHRV